MEKIKNILNDPVHAGTGNQATSEYNTNDPSSASTAPAGNTARDPVGQGGIGSVQQGSAPISSTRLPPSRSDNDVGSTSSINSGLPGSSQGPRTIGNQETRDNLDINKPLPTQPLLGGSHDTDTSVTSGAAPHSSGLANKTDPRVGSDSYGSTGLDSRGTAAGGLSLPDRTTSSTTDSGRSFPLGGGTTGSTTYGPHDSNLGNKADPRIDSDRDGSRPGHQGNLSRSTAGNTAGATTGGSTLMGYSKKTWSHDHNKHGHDYAGDPCENEPPAPGAPHFTSGPHSLDTANRLDPHVSGGGFSGAPLSTAGISISSTGHDHQQRDTPLGTSATGAQSYEPSRNIPGSTADGSLSQTGHHHSGRAAELGPGVGGEGVRSGEVSHDIPISSTTEQERTTTGPHKSDIMNKLDPRVDSDLSKQRGPSAVTGTTGQGSTSTTDPSASREHRYTRDAALAGAGGAAVYKSAKPRDRDLPEGTTKSGYSNPYPPTSTGAGAATDPSITGTSADTDPTSTGHSKGLGSGPASSVMGNTTSIDPNNPGKGHHYARDDGIVGVGAGAAYEADKHLRGSHGDTTATHSMDLGSSRQALSGTSGPDYRGDIGATGPGTTDHHESRYQLSPTSGVPGQAPAHDERSRLDESHTARDAALGAGVGAGVGAAAVTGEAEFSKKEAEREQKAAYKEEFKGEKAAHKEEEKAAKQHQHEEEKAAKHRQHEAEKAEKKHQHDLEKAEKAHEKKLEKEEAKHHKEEPKEGEKKHHGLLGLFHREKADKDLKEDEVARKERMEQEAHPGASTTTASARGPVTGTDDFTEKDKHDRNRLHKDPPPGYGETGYTDPPTKGYASQVSGGTGTTDPRRVIQQCYCAKANLTSVTERGGTIDADRTRDGEGGLTEPHTGLPINTQKGDGPGGTDSTPIAGYHPEQSGTYSTGTTTGPSEGGSFGHFQDHAR
ncbi:MAG: hypothetical protein Q9185_002954 [Variospora sp. 1 TL-2023]